MVNVIGVRFQNAGKLYFFDPGPYWPTPGDFVIVETARGIEFGEVVTPVREISDEQLASEIGNQHVIRRRWGLYYVVAHEGDTFASLAKELNIKDSKLAKFNDLNKKQAIAPGETIWIQEKENKAAMGNDTHTVQAGETLHSISQYYGIRLKNLAKMNHIKENADLAAGTTLLLR